MLKSILTVATVALIAGAAPAIAQQQVPGGNPNAGTGVTPPGVAAAEMQQNQDAAKAQTMTPSAPMTADEAAWFKKCQAMPQEKMMKNARCMSLVNKGK